MKRYGYVKPRGKTNNPRKKITKYEYYQRLRSWQFRRAKGLEEWNKKERPKTRGSKYKKYQVFASIFKTAVSRVNNPLVTHCVKLKSNFDESTVINLPLQKILDFN